MPGAAPAPSHPRPRWVPRRLVVAALFALAACLPAPRPAEPWTKVIPRPETLSPGTGTYTLGPGSSVSVSPAGQGLEPIAELLAQTLRTSTGDALPVRVGEKDASIRLTLDASLTELGEEGYALDVDATGVSIRAPATAGLFYGTQTLLQLLPVALEGKVVHAGPWSVGYGTVRDQPRFAWRGLMLDVARHYFPPSEVRRYVDAMARYKLNRLHLHLTDDQGWRLEIAARPSLAAVGGATEVGGGDGGYFTRDDYAGLVQYAAARFVTVVPEIDLPGHTHAALSSIPELNCDGVAPPAYTGTTVGLSSLCAAQPATTAFVQDVLSEVAAETPGAWLHVGGDEAKMTSPADYDALISLARATVEANGKQLIAWEELANADAGTHDVVQHWLDPALAESAAARGAKVILSPVRRTYLDMQYALDTPKDVGAFWAGFVDVPTAYDWDPGAWLTGVPESAVLGVEAPVWTEFISTPAQLDEMVFPRLLGIAELGWTPRDGLDLGDYLIRLGAHGPRLDALGVGYFAAPQVPWAN